MFEFGLRCGSGVGTPRHDRDCFRAGSLLEGASKAGDEPPGDLPGNADATFPGQLETSPGEYQSGHQIDMFLGMIPSSGISLIP